jgi:hypothetical protein
MDMTSNRTLAEPLAFDIALSPEAARGPVSCRD